MEHEDEFLTLMKKGIRSVNKLSKNLERLVDEPMVEIESAPPKCPHCNIINPSIVMAPSDQIAGPVNEFILVGRCTNCQNDIFGIATGWLINSDQKTAIDNLKQILGRNGDE